RAAFRPAPSPRRDACRAQARAGLDRPRPRRGGGVKRMPGERPWIDGSAAGPRRHAPATRRNREAIAEVLMNALPVKGLVLEVASGTGEHCAHFAREFPCQTWQPSDPDPQARESISAWSAGLANIRPPLDLDAAAPDWPVDHA